MIIQIVVILMKQFPNFVKFKFKKLHKFNKFFLTSSEQKVFFLQSGKFGLQALTAGKLTYKQIELVDVQFDVVLVKIILV